MRCIIALILLAAPAGTATGDWLRLDTRHFQVLSRTSEADLRDLAGKLENAAGILDRLEAGAGISGNPVKVFIFTSRSEFERYGAAKRPLESGYYHSGTGGDVIAFLHAGASSGPVILHEYGHLAIRRAGGRMPLWLDEGLAELYGTIRIRDDEVVWGGPAAARLSRLASARFLNAHEFFEIDRNSGRHSDSQVATFYAQAWAFAHMLQFGPGYSGGLVEFRRLLAQSVPEEEAFERAFRKSRTAALSELSLYLRAGRFNEVRLPVAPPRPHDTGRVSLYSSEEASFALANLLLHLGRTKEATRIYQELVRAQGSAPDLVKLLGDLALAQDRHEEARLHYQRALGLGSKDAALHFEYAMLLRDAGASPERVRHLLELALGLDANLPGLQQFLGHRALDEGNYELAIQRFSGATLLQPQKPAVWLGLAYAYRAAGNREAARAAAQQSANLAREETELRMAEAALKNLNAPPDALPSRSGPKTIVPDTWRNREGDRRLEGTLVRIDCEGSSAKLHLRTAGGTTILSISDPRKVVLRNAPGASSEFPCGALAKPVQIAVEFVSAPEGKDAAGEVTVLEYK